MRWQTQGAVYWRKGGLLSPMKSLYASVGELPSTNRDPLVQRIHGQLEASSRVPYRLLIPW